MSLLSGRNFGFIWVVALACACSAATTAPDADDDPAAFIAESQKALEPWKAMPTLSPQAIDNVIRFREVAGLLTVDWPILHSGPKNGRLTLTDLPGQACVLCRGPASSNHFYPSFEYWDLTQPDHRVRHLQVMCTASSLMVCHDTEGIHGYLQIISLLENMGSPDNPPVTLRVQLSGGGSQMQNIVLSAPTLERLLLDHHEEFERFLRPMFNMFHQESAVFLMDDRIDWQVLGDQWQSPPGLAEKISAIMDQLNSAEFSKRQQAEKDLQAMGQPAALYLRKADPRNWSVEQTMRVNAFLGEYFVLTDKQVQEYAANRDFLLDCLGNEDPALREAAAKRLDSVLGRNIDYILNQPSADRTRSIAELRLPPSTQSSRSDSAP